MKIPNRADPRSFSSGSEISGTIAGEVDGDGASMKLSNGKVVNLRLAYGDAPETEKKDKDGKVTKLGQPFGPEAQQHLAKLVTGKKLTAKVIEPASEKNYWRPVVVLQADGVDVNKEMLGSGYHWPQSRTIPIEYWDAAAQGQLSKSGAMSEKNPERASKFRARLFSSIAE